MVPYNVKFCPHGAFQIGESLPPEAAHVLSYLSPSLPQFIAEPDHLRCTGNASIWESPEVHELYAMMNPLGSGWHLDRLSFDQMLRDAVSATGKDRYVRGKFTRAEKKDGSWTVSVDLNSREIEYCANWLIDASGRKASVARKVCLVPSPKHNTLFDTVIAWRRYGQIG